MYSSADAVKKVRDGLAEYYKTGEYEALEEAIQIYIYFIIIEKTKEEDLAFDFVSHIKPQMKKMIDLYIPEKGDFFNFLHSYVFSMFGFFKKVIYAQNRKTQMMNIVLQNEFDNDMKNGNWEVSEKTEEYAVIKKGCSEKEKMFFLALTIYVSPLLGEYLIENISAFLRMEKEELMNLIKKADEDSVTRERKVEKHRMLRNHYYMRGFDLYKKKQFCELSDAEKRMQEKCRKYQQYHSEQIAQYSHISHRDIARVLNIDYAKVRGYIYQAKKRLKEYFEEMEKN